MSDLDKKREANIKKKEEAKKAEIEAIKDKKTKMADERVRVSGNSHA